MSKINEEASKPVHQEAEQIDDISVNNRDIDQSHIAETVTSKIFQS